MNFKESVRTQAEAMRVVEGEWLRVSSFVDAMVPISALVSVPVGSECASAERLNANPAVETSDVVVNAID